MQSGTELAKQVTNRLMQGKPETVSAPSTALPAELIDRVFQALHSIYHKRFLDALAGAKVEAVKKVWMAGLSGITEREIADGLKALVKHAKEWPPTLPEFRAMCRPPLNYEACFLEAVDQMHRRHNSEDVWSSPAVYWAATRVGGDLLTSPYKLIKERWKIALDAAVRDLEAGVLPASVPPRRLALPDKGQITNRESAQRHLAEIRALLGGEA